MVVAMEQAGTETLVIDLRHNRGGHSVMGDILVYFLYGKRALWEVVTYGNATGGGVVSKYSDLFWEQAKSRTSLEQVNEGRPLPLQAGDYDFAAFSGDVENSATRIMEVIRHHERTWWALSPTFWEEYQSLVYSGYYCPRNVVVLTGAKTFDSGSALARTLYLAGATSVGTPLDRRVTRSPTGSCGTWTTPASREPSPQRTVSSSPTTRRGRASSRSTTP